MLPLAAAPGCETGFAWCVQVFQSELVVKEFDSIMGELRQLSMMAARFPDFDLQGKEMFLDKV